MNDKYEALLNYLKDIFKVADMHTPYYLVPEELGSEFQSALAETYGRLVEGIMEGTLTQEQLDIIGSCFQNPPPKIYRQWSDLKQAYNFERKYHNEKDE